jgi:hypothetical protein
MQPAKVLSTSNQAMSLGNMGLANGMVPKPAAMKPSKGKVMKTPKAGQKVTLKAKAGQKKVTYTKGGLHKSLGVAQGKKIPAGKMKSALAGKYGAKAKKEAMFKKNVLTGKK